MEKYIDEVIADFVEKGAALEHVRWAKWQNYLHSFLTWNNDLQAWVLPHDKKAHWQRQIETYYGALSEKEKESDRKEVREYLPLLTTALKEQERRIKEDFAAKLPEESPHYRSLAQSLNGINYCSTCEQAWEECSCAARNTGFNLALRKVKSLLTPLPSKE